MSSNKKIVYGNVELDDDEFDPKYVKIRVTTFIDLEVVEALKKKAKTSKSKYQTLLNQILREAVLSPTKPISSPLITEEKLRKILREELKIQDQKKR
jgi:hypothetical protein